MTDLKLILEQALDLAFVVEADRVCGGDFRQAGHRHDLACDDDDELGSSR
jgi:hypothetical protein